MEAAPAPPPPVAEMEEPEPEPASGDQVIITQNDEIFLKQIGDIALDNIDSTLDEFGRFLKNEKGSRGERWRAQAQGERVELRGKMGTPYEGKLGGGGGSYMQVGGMEEIAVIASFGIGLRAMADASMEAIAILATCKETFSRVESSITNFFNSGHFPSSSHLNKSTVLKFALIMIIFFKLYLLHGLVVELLKVLGKFSAEVQEFAQGAEDELNGALIQGFNTAVSNLVHIHYGPGELFDPESGTEIQFIKTLLDEAWKAHASPLEESAAVAVKEDVHVFPWVKFGEFINGESGAQIIYNELSNKGGSSTDPITQETIQRSAREAVTDIVEGHMQAMGDRIFAKITEDMRDIPKIIEEGAIDFAIGTMIMWMTEYGVEAKSEEIFDNLNKLVLQHIPHETENVIENGVRMVSIYVDKKISRVKSLLKQIKECSIGIFRLLPVIIFWCITLKRLYYSSLGEEAEAALIEAAKDDTTRFFKAHKEICDEDQRQRCVEPPTSSPLVLEPQGAPSRRSSSPSRSPRRAEQKRKKKKKKKSKKPKKKKQSKKKPKKKPKKKASRGKGKTRRR